MIVRENVGSSSCPCRDDPPGQQSQIDWGQTQVPFRSGRRTVHFFVLTLGYSRRGIYWPSADERMAQFLDAHERAFEHFGGHTREHLYDRTRCVCYPNREGRVVWNPTFKSLKFVESSEHPPILGIQETDRRGKSQLVVITYILATCYLSNTLPSVASSDYPAVQSGSCSGPNAPPCRSCSNCISHEEPLPAW